MLAGFVFRVEILNANSARSWILACGYAGKVVGSIDGAYLLNRVFVAAKVWVGREGAVKRAHGFAARIGVGESRRFLKSSLNFRDCSILERSDAVRAARGSGSAATCLSSASRTPGSRSRPTRSRMSRRTAGSGSSAACLSNSAAVEASTPYDFRFDAEQRSPWADACHQKQTRKRTNFMNSIWRRGRDSSRQVLANYSNGESYALSCGVATNYPYGQFSLVCLLWPQCGLQNRHQIATKSMSRLGCESSILSQPVLKARRLSDARRQCSNPERRAEFTSFVGPARVPHRWRRPSDTLAWELRRSGRVPGWKQARAMPKTSGRILARQRGNDRDLGSPWGVCRKGMVSARRR